MRKKKEGEGEFEDSGPSENAKTLCDAAPLNTVLGLPLKLTE